MLPVFSLLVKLHDQGTKDSGPPSLYHVAYICTSFTMHFLGLEELRKLRFYPRKALMVDYLLLWILLTLDLQQRQTKLQTILETESLGPITMSLGITLQF